MNIKKNLLVLLYIQTTLLVILSQLSFPLSSDELVFPEVFRDIITSADLRNWAISTSPNYFPDSLILLICHLIIPNWKIALLSYHILFFFILPIGTLYLNKCYGNRPYSLSMLAPLSILLLILFEFIYHDKRLIFEFMTRLPHFGIVFSTLICLGLFLRFLKKPANNTLIIYALILMTTATSDFLFQVIFTIPMICSLIYRIWTDPGKDSLQTNILFIIITISASLTGFLINSYFNSGFFYHLPKGIPSSITSGQLNTHWEKIPLYIQNFKDVFTIWFRTYPLIMIINFLSMSFLAIRLTSLHIKQEKSPKEAFLIIFTFSCVLSNIFIGIASGRIEPVDTIRYLWASLFIPMITSIILLQSYKDLLDRSRPLIPILLILLNLFCAHALWHLSQHKKIPAKEYYYPNIVACLDQNKYRYGLKDGFADYWVAPLIRLYSKENLIANTLRTQDLRIRFWNNSLSHYHHKDYNFIIIDEERMKNGLHADLVKKVLGEPNRSFTCRDKKVYIYDDDRLNQWFMMISKEWPGGLPPS